MKVSRRGFIASIAAAVVGAAVAPEIIPIPAKPKVGGITYAALEEAYRSCQYGREEPDLICVSPRTYSEIVSRIEVMQRFTQKHESGVTGQLWITNSKNPLNPHLNQLIELA